MSETHDPWAGPIERIQGRMIAAGHRSVEGLKNTAALMAEAEAAFLRQCLDAIDAARAAEATQHQQLVDHLQLQVTAGLEDYHAVSARLAAVEAERDSAVALAVTLEASRNKLFVERDRLKAALSQARQDFGMVACDGSLAGIAVGRVDAALSGEGTAKP